MSTPAPRLIARARTKLLLGSAAALTLATGAVLRRDEPARPRQEGVAPMLEETVERREQVRVVRALQDAARRVRAYAVVFHSRPSQEQPRSEADFARAQGSPPEPSGLGIAVTESGEVLTHRVALGGPGPAAASTFDGGSTEVSAAAYDPERALVLVRLRGARLSVPPAAAGAPAPGDLVLAAASAGAYELVAPRFIRSVGETAYLLDAAGLPPGAPLFNLEGEVVGIASGPESPVVHPVAVAIGRLRRLIAEGRAMPSTLGMLLQEPDERLRARLGEGMVVAGVEPGGAAARAGVRAGDLLVELVGSPLGDLAAVHERVSALPAGQEVAVALRRSGRPQRLSVVPEATLADPRAIAMEAPADAPPASAVFRARDLDAAAVPPEARVLAVNGRSLTNGRLPPAVRRQGPPWLAHLHDGTRPFFAIVGKANP